MARQERAAGPSGRSRSSWERLVSAYEHSGLTRQAFCDEHDISVSSLDYWRRKLRDDASTGFIELPAFESGSGWEIELELGGGMVLRLRRR